MPHSNALREFWLRFYEALSNGDHVFVERHLSRSEGAPIIGTDRNARRRGPAATRRMLSTELEEMVGVQIVPGELQACCVGAVGCVTDRPKLRLPDGTEIPMRVTSVICKEESDWRIVLWHASFAVPDQEAFGTALTAPG
jgi:hypothetical protein